MFKLLKTVLMCSVFIGLFGVVAFGAASTDKAKTIRIAHAQLPESFPGRIIQAFADRVSASDAKLTLKVFPSAVLGDEKSLNEQVKAGTIDMIKVSVTTVSAFNNIYSVFAIPYLFHSNDHYVKALQSSQALQNLMVANKKDGYIALGWLPNGPRSVYLKEDKAVKTPADLKGKKLRIQNSPAMARALTLMGSTPVPMSYSEVYTSIQQGILDGAENTEAALSVDRHEEVAKSFTYTEHVYSPDIFFMSSRTWDSLSAHQQDVIKRELKKAYDDYVTGYVADTQKYVDDAKSHGVKFYTIDKTPFIEATKPMADEFVKQGPVYKELYDDIQKYK